MICCLETCKLDQNISTWNISLLKRLFSDSLLCSTIKCKIETIQKLSFPSHVCILMLDELWNLNCVVWWCCQWYQLRNCVRDMTAFVLFSILIVVGYWWRARYPRTCWSDRTSGLSRFLVFSLYKLRKIDRYRLINIGIRQTEKSREIFKREQSSGKE